MDLELEIFGTVDVDEFEEGVLEIAEEDRVSGLLSSVLGAPVCFVRPENPEKGFPEFVELFDVAPKVNVAGVCLMIGSAFGAAGALGCFVKPEKLAKGLEAFVDGAGVIDPNELNGVFAGVSAVSKLNLLCHECM